MKTKALMFILLCRCLGVFAEPTVSDVVAKQRYPWNGAVNLNFTITSTSGTKYDTSFTAMSFPVGVSFV